MADKKKKANLKAPVRYLELLYMTPTQITVKDIAAVLQGKKEIKLELWEEMNVLELELPNQSSVDLEPVDVSFSNPSDAAFVKNRNIRTIFAVTLNELDLNEVKSYFELIIDEFSGFLCSDTEDFKPIYVGTIANKA